MNEDDRSHRGPLHVADPDQELLPGELAAWRLPGDAMTFLVAGQKLAHAGESSAISSSSPLGGHLPSRVLETTQETGEGFGIVTERRPLQLDHLKLRKEKSA